MWSILQSHLVEARQARTLIKHKYLINISATPQQDFIGAEFNISSRQDLRIFSDKFKSDQVSGVSDLCPEFALLSSSALQVEDSFIDTQRDFLSRLSSHWIGTTGNSAFMYSRQPTSFIFLVTDSIFMQRLALLRIFLFNRRRSRVYVLRRPSAGLVVLNNSWLSINKSVARLFFACAIHPICLLVSVLVVKK